MLQAKRPSRSATSQRGAAALALVGFVAFAVGGLAVAMTLQARGAAIDVDRSDAQVHALELAETGLARAQMEIAANRDSDGDGIGNAHGSFAGGTYAVTGTNNTGSEWTLVATGRVPKSLRRIEQRVRRSVTSASYFAVQVNGNIDISGGLTQTDAFDSRLGTYASQAVNTDAYGPYALGGGGVGANGNITASAGIVRGDAIPGVGGTTTGAGVVTGSTAPRTVPMSLPNPPYAEFLAASVTNNNGNWTVAGGNVSYDAGKKTFSVTGGGKVTFPGGTYFFTKFTITGGSTVEFTGPSKVYDIGTFSSSGGSMSNLTGLAKNLSVIVHPYSVPGYTAAKSISSSISGGSTSILTYYGPQTDLTISGGSDVFGALVAKNVTLAGGMALHYDIALAPTLAAAGPAHMTQLYWIESKPPLN